MAYLISHHGTFWFQIRVPAALVPHYGTRFVRQNLQINDRAPAQQLALQLASQWLMRFYAQRLGEGEPLPVNLPVNDVAISALLVPMASARAACVTTATALPRETSPTLASKHTKKATVADSFDSLARYWRSLHSECSRSTFSEVDAVVKDFSTTIRKRPDQLERLDITAYRDRLITSGLARATVAKKISFIGALLQTAVDAGALPHNVARGLRIPKPMVASINRRAFTADELKRIFASPIYRKNLRPVGGGGEAAAWVPLIALSTGARLEEICQLKLADIHVDPKHGPLMTISDSGEGQHVKTASSRRTLPLHPALVRAGLLDYWETMKDAGHERLFPALTPDHDERHSGNFSKWFARHLRSSRGCAIRDPAVVFHSFRHTFKSLCREAGITEEIHDALTGHAGVTVGRSYGHMPLSALVQAVARIRFPALLPRVVVPDVAPKRQHQRSNTASGLNTSVRKSTIAVVPLTRSRSSSSASGS